MSERAFVKLTQINRNEIFNLQREVDRTTWKINQSGQLFADSFSDKSDESSHFAKFQVETFLSDSKYWGKNLKYSISYTVQ